MLLNKDKIAHALVDADLRAMKYGYWDADSHMWKAHGSRFKSVVDSTGHECGVVSKRYRLVTHGNLVAAADLASDKLGVDLECGNARYHNGNFKVDLYLPNTYTVPGDPSGIRPQVSLGNGYGGSAALTGKAGVFRLLCTNGATIGKVVRRDYQKHVGDFDLMRFVEDLMLAVICRAEEYQKVALEAASTTADLELVEKLILETTPKKYHATFHTALETNVRDLGDTVWAVMQAISEVSTHDMKGLNAGDWQMRQTNHVLTQANILV